MFVGLFNWSVICRQLGASFIAVRFCEASLFFSDSGLDVVEDERESEKLPLWKSLLNKHSKGTFCYSVEVEDVNVGLPTGPRRGRPSTKSTEAKMNRYELSTQLGDGSFGRVMKATSKETGEVVRWLIVIFGLSFEKRIALLLFSLFCVENLLNECCFMLLPSFSLASTAAIITC